MPGTGVSTSGAVITGWAHVEQSIRKILTTATGTRVMRREFGSEVMALIDSPMTERVVLAFYVAIANSITRWEPRYRLTAVSVEQADATGVLSIRLAGDYFPRGHLGDFTVSSNKIADVLIGS